MGTSHGKRNYELDVLKFIFTLLVFVYHTKRFIGENTRFFITDSLGWISVHFFFVVSGLLMMNSYISKQNSDNVQMANCGKKAFCFVLHKFKGFALEYWTSLLMRTAVQALLYSTGILVTARIFCEIIPDIFCLQTFGISLDMNGPAWYISSMLAAMIPLIYILGKSKDFFLYIFAPITAMLLLGYMYHQDYVFVPQENMHGIMTGGIIRAICGLCFGVVAWLISQKLKESVSKRPQKALLTIAEVGLYLMFFVLWFFGNWDYLYFSAILLLPIALGITFSETSYVHKLFSFKVFKPLGSLSLAIYLNHSAAIQIVDVYFKGYSYKLSVLLCVGFTVVLCILYYSVLLFVKWIYNCKLKFLFTNKDSINNT